MVKIITGKINQLKTTTMIQLYESTKQGDGFASVKVMDGSNVRHYLAMRLSTLEQRVFVVHESDVQKKFENNIAVGPYTMNLDALHWMEQIYKELMEKRIQPIYLDEIGLLELQGLGFDRILRSLIASNLDLVLVVRSNLLNIVQNHYGIEHAQIIHTA